MEWPVGLEAVDIADRSCTPMDLVHCRELSGQKQEKSFVGGVSFVVADGKCSCLGIFCVAMTKMCKWVGSWRLVT